MPTIKDIAREAGVSHGTVSNVLNKTGKVSIEKIKLVEEAARKLGYVPNAQAQMLRQGTPTSVALLLPTLREDIYLDLYQSLQTAMHKNGYETFIYETNDIAGTEKAILEKLPFSGIAAVVSVSCLLDSEPSAYQAIPCPVFFAERIPEQLSKNQYALSFDYRSAGKCIASFAEKNGWERIAFFCDPNNFCSSRELLAGIRQTLRCSEEKIQVFSSDISLTTAKAFSIIQAETAFDCVITSSSLRAKALDFALQLSKPAKRPAIFTVGAASHSYCTTFEFDYSQIGTKISKLFTAYQQDASVLPGQTVFEGKGIPYTFPNVIRQSPCELTMLTLNSPSTQALQKLIPLFEEISGIRLKISSLAYDDLHSYIEMLNKHFYFDLVRMDVAHLNTLGPSTYLPLDEIGISPDIFPVRLIQPAYNNYSMVNDTRYTLPLDPSVQVFLYRKDLFENATLCRAYYERYREALAVPETIEQFLHVAEFFTAHYNPDSPTRYGTTLTTGSSFFASSDFLPYFMADHYDTFCSGEPIRLNTPEMIQAMEKYQKMAHFATHENTWTDSIQQFAAGNVASVTIYSNHTGSIINTKHSNIAGKISSGIIPGHHPLLGGGVLGVSKHSSKIEACRQFFRWYYSPDTASLLAQLGGSSPLLDIYNDFKNRTVFPWLSASKKSFEIGIRGVDPDIAPDFSTVHYEFALGIAIRNLIAGSATPQEAAAMAQAIYDAPSAPSKSI